MVSLWNLSYSSGKLSKWRRQLAEQHYHYWWNMGHGLWTWVKAPVSWMETWRITEKTEILPESISCKFNGNFGLRCPGNHFVPHGETVMHSTMLRICKITYVTQLGINGHNCKMWSFYVIMLLHIRRFVSGICYDAGGGKYWSIHHTHRIFCLWSWFNPQVESSVAWVQISYTRWHCHCSSTLDYDKYQPGWSRWYSSTSTTLAAHNWQSRELLWRLVKC